MLGFMLTACSGDADAVRDANPRVEQILEEARQTSADPEAIAVLEEAVATGNPIATEQVRQGVFRTIECLESLGLQVRSNDDPSAPGGVFFMYGIEGREGDLPLELDAAAQDCQMRDFVLLDTAQQIMAPQSQESLEAALEPYRAALEACVLNRGGDVDSDWTARELAERAGAEDVSVGFETPCIDEVGFIAP